MAKTERIKMTDDRIIDLWKMGYTIQQLSKEYVRNNKSRGIRITQLEAQRYVEPVVFKYQTSLIKLGKELRKR